MKFLFVSVTMLGLYVSCIIINKTSVCHSIGNRITITTQRQEC